MLFYQCILAFAIVCIWSTTSVYGELHDTNENCAFWASEGTVNIHHLSQIMLYLLFIMHFINL